MPKAKKTKQVPTFWNKALTWADKHRLWAVIIAAGVVLAMWGIAAGVGSHVKTVHEQEQFYQAQVSLQEIYSDIVSDVGEAAQHNATQSCSYTSSEFSQGARSCSVGVSFSYPSSTRRGARDKSSLIERVLETHKEVTNVHTIKIENAPDSLNVLAVNFRLNKIKNCISDYWYVHSPKSIGLPQGLIYEGAPQLMVNVSCVQAARADYYRVIKP